MSSKLENHLNLWFYFCSKPFDSRPPRKGCGPPAGRPPQYPRAASALPAADSTPGSCCQATGWGGAVRRGPARGEEARGREAKDLRGPAPPVSRRPEVSSPSPRVRTQCCLCQPMASKTLPSRGRLGKGFLLGAHPSQSHPWSEAPKDLTHLLAHSSRSTDEETEAHTGERQGCE